MKICVRCSAENSSDFKYCKLCGAELPCVDQKVCKKPEPAEKPVADINLDSEDISIAEMSKFVGKNSGDIVPRFIKMQNTGKSLSFCMPAFLLGFFFGLPGVAVWLLYRKMIKPAAIVFAVSALLSAVPMFFTFGILCEYYRSAFSAVDYYLNSFAGSSAEAAIWLIEYCGELTSWLSSELSKVVPWVVTAIIDYGFNFVAPIVLSFFTVRLYKDYSIQKISSLKRNASHPMLYSVALTREGGTSVGTAVLGSLIYLAVTMLISAVPIIAAALG